MNENDIQLLHFGETYLNPVGLLATILLAIAMLVLPRRYAVCPMIIMACFVSQAQRVVLFTLNFDLLRVLVLVGLSRVAFRQEWREYRVKSLDIWFIIWALTGLVTMCLLYSDLAVAKFKLGMTFDALGMYFLFRMLVREWKDVQIITMGFIIASAFVAVAFLIEESTGHNMFAFFGGVNDITVIREGRLRCQGAFSHPILAGCFWAILMPLMACQWWQGTARRWLGIFGLLMAAIVIVTCASSTPVAAVGIGGLGMCAFPLRHRLKAIRWIGFVTLLLLHLFMEAPVWHLLSRFDFAGGSSSWYRYHIIDLAVQHINEWWLIGRRGYMAGWEDGLWDVTNQYLMEAFEGGILLLGLFLAIFVTAFHNVGKILIAAGDDRIKCWTAWALGVSLLIHAVNFISVSYFGQIIMLWYLVLAIVASLTPSKLRIRSESQRTIRLALTYERIANDSVDLDVPSNGLISR